MWKYFLALLLVLPAAGLLAQSSPLSLAEKMQRGVVMDFAAFKAMSDGNTITYNNGTDDVYREYYRPGTNRIVIEWTEARDPSQMVCDLGTWYVQEELICFDWQASGEVCALWVDYNGEYISAIATDDGQMTGNLEVISNITTTPLFCEVGMVELFSPIPEMPAG